MKEFLQEYKEKLSKLNEKEINERNIYLKQLQNGTLSGPLTSIPSIDKPWLTKYEDEAILSTMPKKTIYEYFIDSTKGFDDMIAISYYGKKITYNELKNNIEIISKKLQYLGIKKGMIVTLALPTCPETTYLFYALNKLGAVANFIHPLSNQKEFENLIKEVNSEFVFAYDGCIKNISPIIDNTNLSKVISISPFESMPLLLREYLKIKNKTKIQNDKIITWSEFEKIKTVDITEYTNTYKENDLAVMTHTSGTTGVPKSAMHTNDGFNRMVHQYKVVAKNFKTKDTMLTVLPPLASFMLCNCMHMPLCLGVTVDMVCKYDKEDLSKYLLKNKKGTFHMMGIPPYFTEILNDEKLKNKDLSRLGYMVVGGDKLDIEQEKKINEFYKSHNAKVLLTKGYGETEIVSSATYTFENSNKLGSVGIPLVKTSIKIVDIDTQEELSYNNEGEILFLSPTIMKGYYKNEQETKASIVEYGKEKWVRTGDVGYIDNDGNLFVTGRIKRMFLTVGNDKSLTKAFPDRIENELYKCSYIEKCLVVGKPDKIKNNIPKAYIELKKGYSYNEKILEELIKICEINLRETLRPDEYIFIEKMPLTNIGKIKIDDIEKEENINVLTRKIVK